MYALGSFDGTNEITFSHADTYFLLSEQVKLSGFLINNLLEPILAKQQHLFVLSADLDIVIDAINKPNIQAFKQLDQNKQLHFFEMLEVKKSYYLHYFQQLFKELKVYSKFRHSNLVIHLSGSLINATDENELEKIIHYFNQQAIKWQLNLVIMSSGLSNRILTKRLYAYSKSISGLLNISRYTDTQILHLSFWHQVSGLIFDQKFKLSFSQNSFKLLPHLDAADSELTQTDNRHLDENEVWLVETVVNSFEQLPEHYHLVKNNEQLYEVANKLTFATVVFTVNKEQSVIDLAKICYQLRKDRGPWLKIVLQNIEGMVRHKDESIFYLAGVNLILYDLNQASRFISRIQSIQGFKFTRELPAEFSYISDKIETSQAFGYRHIHQFCQEVIRHSDNAESLSVSAALVRLTLLPSARPLHALKMIHLKRDGDFFTHYQDEIVLYLSACRANDVQTALSHLFYLDINDFFLAKSITTSHLDIQRFCRQLLANTELKNEADLSKYLNHKLVLDNVYDPFEIELMSSENVKIPDEPYLSPLKFEEIK